MAMQAEASGKPEQGAAPDGVAPARQLRNQFNFSERGAQTLYYGLRARGTDTEMPPTAEMSGGCSHWEIYDAYIADQRQLRSQVLASTRGCSQLRLTKVCLGWILASQEACRSDMLASS